MENEISVVYNLPKDWDKQKTLSFEQLSQVIDVIHDSAYSASVKAINRFATVRNYLIGFYVVEYEQGGQDRAKYGDKLIKRLVEKINKKGLNETLFKNCRKFYLTYPHIKTYLETGVFPSLEGLPIRFMELDSFMHYYKKLLNNKSYFSVIVDQQSPISSLSKRAINDVVGKRINADISMKVACQPDEWETYYDLNGQIVEAVHDYGVVELDDSLSQYVKKRRIERMGE